MAHDSLRRRDGQCQEASALVSDPVGPEPKPAKGGRGTSKVDHRGPLAAFVVVGAFLVYSATAEPAKPGSVLPWTLNPTGYLSYGSWLLLWLITMPAKELFNIFLCFLGTSVLGLKRMDEGDGKVAKLEVLETVDLCYLAFNTIVEFLGLNHIAAFLLDGPFDYSMKDFTVCNGLLAFVVVMLVNDIIYYPFHVVAHKRAFYPYCHKQHHRQFVPFRGYKDAANQHPLEQSYGFSIFIASMWVGSRTLGLHAAVGVVATLTWAILNIFNHLAFDSRVHLPLPYPAFPRDHQMHHRFVQCNYSTLTTICDRMFGSFKPYKSLKEPLTTEAQEPKIWYETSKDPDEKQKPPPLTPERPEAFPSHWSVLTFQLLLMVAAVLVEVVRTSGETPSLHMHAIFLKPCIIACNVAVLFYGIQVACASVTEQRPKRNERVYTKPRMMETVKHDNTQLIGGKSIWKTDACDVDKPAPFKLR